MSGAAEREVHGALLGEAVRVVAIIWVICVTSGMVSGAG